MNFPIKNLNMHHVANLLFMALVLVLLGCGQSNEERIEGDAANQPAEEDIAENIANQPAAARQSSPEPAEETVSDDPNNPWVLGFRWSGTPGTKFKARLASRDGNYELLKAQGGPAFQANSFDFEVKEEHNVFLGTVFVKGLKLRANIKSETGSLKIEMFDGRMADHSDPTGGVVVRNVLSSGEASGQGSEIKLEAGEPIETADESW